MKAVALAARATIFCQRARVITLFEHTANRFALKNDYECYDTNMVTRACVGCALMAFAGVAYGAEPFVARFSSDAPPEAVERAKCSLDATLTIDGRAHSLDVDGCEPHEGAIHATVRVEAGAVVVEVEAPDDLSPTGAEELRAAVDDVAAKLHHSIEGAEKAARDKRALAIVERLLRERDARHEAERRRRVRRDEGLFTAGLATIGIGGAAFVAGAVTLWVGIVSSAQGVSCLYSPCSGSQGSQANTIMTVGGVMMGIGGGAALLFGLPMTLAALNKVDASTSARLVLSPAGAALAGTF